MPRGVLLYVGAHVDTYALTCAELRKAYRLFVYVDGTPGSKYWPHDCPGARESASEETMMSCMLRMGGRYAGLSEFTRQPCGGYAASLADDSSVIYYFNSPDCIGVPRAVLDSVTALYMKGYEPGASVVDLLPNVTYVYSTSLCVGPAYYAVCAKGGYDGTHERPWPPEIYDSYWDEEEGEFVIEHSDDSPRQESDAPTRYERYEDHTDSDYSTDSECSVSDVV
jgi:hypothetical protein